MSRIKPPTEIKELLDETRTMLEGMEDYEGMGVADCLQFFTKEDLSEMVRGNGYAVKTSLKKAELVEKLSREIIRQFQLYIDNMPLEEYFRLYMCLKNNESELSEDLYLLGIPFFSQGFVYFLESTDTKEWRLIFPKELSLLLLESTTEEKLERYMKRQLLCLVMRGLAMIYGVYPRQQLEIVWKHLLKEEASSLSVVNSEETGTLKNMDKILAWENIADLVDSCISFSRVGQTGFEVFSNYIMVEGLGEDRYYDEILEESQGKDYYMPSLTEILYYAENDFDLEGKPYLRLKQYFEKNTDLDEEEIEDLMDELCSIYVEDSGIRLAMEAIDEAGIPLDSESVMKELLPLLTDLSNSTRKWINKGYTPNELAAQKSAIPLRKPLDNVIQFPSDRAGRPSPKGSGPKRT